MAQQVFEVMGRRADGRGTRDIDSSVVAEVAKNIAHHVFHADHSWTMVWVTERGATVALEIFTREPAGSDAELARAVFAQ